MRKGNQKQETCLNAYLFANFQKHYQYYLSSPSQSSCLITLTVPDNETSLVFQMCFHPFLWFSCSLLQSLSESCVKNSVYYVSRRGKKSDKKNYFIWFVKLIKEEERKRYKHISSKKTKLLDAGFDVVWLIIFLHINKGHRKINKVKRRQLRYSVTLSLQQATAVESWELSWWE